MLVSSVTNKRRQIKSIGNTQLVGPVGTGRIFGAGNVYDEIPVYTYWNLFDKSASITLSGNDLVALATSGADAAVRAVDGKSAGKWYFEIQNEDNGVGLTNGEGVGLSSGGRVVDTIFFNGLQALTLLGGTGVFLNGAFQFAMGGSLVDNTVCIAWDADNNRAWFRLDDGDWNADPLADPETNVGGVDTSSIDANGLWPACGMSNSNVQWTANFGTTDFAFEKPNGFSGWTTEGS
jgi:hypothetical protein